MTPNEIIEISIEDCYLLNDFMGKFHHSKITWNELMPVIYKIEALEDNTYLVDIGKTGTYITMGDEYGNRVVFCKTVSTTRIEGTFTAITQFIHWHNSLKK